MKIGFECPDGAVIKVKDCLSKCRLGERCLTKSTLSVMAYVRPWSGKPSTTMLIAPTRQQFLMLTKEFYIEKDKRCLMGN